MREEGKKIHKEITNKSSSLDFQNTTSKEGAGTGDTKESHETGTRGMREGRNEIPKNGANT